MQPGACSTISRWLLQGGHAPGPVPSVRRTSWPRARHVLRALQPQRSFDGEEELDSSLAEELARLKPREQYAQAVRHMDLVWRVTKNRNSRATCTCCKGTKEEECRWCHGTGAMMVGDTMYASPDGRRSLCPICKGNGYLPCERCRGTGFTAGWMREDDQPGQGGREPPELQQPYQ